MIAILLFLARQAALLIVQPSAKREGFATIPGVTWDDVGALKDVREELTMAILVTINRHVKILFDIFLISYLLKEASTIETSIA